MSEADVLQRAMTHAIAYLESLETRPVAAQATPAALRARIDKPLPAVGTPASQVIDELVADVEGGILGSTSGRFFGWVIGGALPVAVAADWLTTAWGQNAASYACGPAEAVVEEVCGTWLKELLGIPAAASFGFVTGCQMAHTTALAAARYKLLRDRNWDVERRGLAAAPRLRLLTSRNRHESILRSARLLGLGTDAVEIVGCDDDGGIRLKDLESALRREAQSPTIVSLQAGDLNTGAYDPFKEAVAAAHAVDAWVHIDGAFGLWAAASERHRHLLDGADEADSWAADGHKWLNLPFDSGFVFVRDPTAHSAVFSQEASYAIPVDGVRSQKDWNPEWSRRGRGFAAYAAIRALGRSGIADIVERCCTHAERLVREIGALAGAEVLSEARVNQGLVRFLAQDGDHDRRTDEVIERIQAEGTAWFGGTTWRGMRAMRVSVCNWRTTDADVRRAVESVRRVLAEYAA